MSKLTDPDKATDWIAIGLSVLFAVTVWALFIFEYAFVEPFGEANRYLIGLAGVLTLLAVVTLFGYEKTKKVLELKP